MRCILTAILFVLILGVPFPARAQNDPESRREAIEAIYPIMIAALEEKNFGRARNICDQAIIWEPQNPVHHYNMACIEAQAGGPRLPYAMRELELAIALGFNDANHLKNDSDLVPLRDDPKFAELIRKAAVNATAIDAIANLRIPEKPAQPETPVAATTPEFEQPAPTAFKDGVPVGLYFMTRFWMASRSLEKAVWYFAPDGTVYQNLLRGFSKGDLAAHAGLKGRAVAAKANKLEITWSDGRKVVSNLERDGNGFSWDMGIFTAVHAFEDSSELVGRYDGGESLSVGESSAAVAKGLELRADGTFTWEGVSFLGASSTTSKVSAGGSGATRGHWQLGPYSLVLTDDKGVTWRGIVFPYDDDRTPVKPDRMFFGGIMYKRQ